MPLEAQTVKNLPAVQETQVQSQFRPRFRKIHWRSAWQPTPVFLPGKFHGQRILAGYSHQELVTTEQLTLSFSGLE